MIERRKICIDDSKSHTTGILPYVRYDENYNGPSFVSIADGSGNWGNFPMDFIILKKESTTVAEGIESVKVIKRCEEEGFDECVELNEGIEPTERDVNVAYEKYADNSRLKYLDIMRMYNDIQKILNASTYGKVVERDVKSENGISGRVGTDCEYEISAPSEKEIVFVEGVIDDDGVSRGRYDFIPIHESSVTTTDGVIYRFPFYDESDNNGLIENGKYYVILSDYDKVKECESRWWHWWSGNGETYKTHFPIDTPDYLEGGDITFDFCRIVEKYIIGKVEVPQEYEGIKVPEYVYYSNIPVLKAWFEKNGITTDADTIGKDRGLINEYHERGGEKFYQFLSNIDLTGVYVHGGNIPTIEEGEYKCVFAPPYISVPVNLVDYHDYAGVYEPYLYSYSNDEGIHAIDTGYNGEDLREWYVPSGDLYTSAISNGESAEDSKFPIYTESKLNYLIDDDATEIGGVVGLWAEFDDSKTPLFKCVYHEGESSVTGKLVTHRRVFDDGHEDIQVMEDIEEVPASTKTNANRVILQFRNKNTEKSRIDETVPQPNTDGDAEWMAYPKTAYTVYDYGWWECTRQSKEDASSIICADGVMVGKNEEKYRTVSILECFKNLIDENGLSDGDFYYFVVKKDNGLLFDGAGVPVTNDSSDCVFFSTPYKVGSFHNVKEIEGTEQYIGDYIDDISISGNQWTIRYTIGATINGNGSAPSVSFSKVEDTGVMYEEKYGYMSGTMRTFIDGYKDVLVYYESIGIEESKQTIYSEDYGLFRKVNMAKVVGYERGSCFSSGAMMSAMVFTRDDTDAFQEDPSKAFSVLIDRGAAAAFERHFKLGECNTFEDLQNYGNNFYNLK